MHTENGPLRFGPKSLQMVFQKAEEPVGLSFGPLDIVESPYNLANESNKLSYVKGKKKGRITLKLCPL